MIRTTTGAVALSLLASTALAGGVERSSQSVSAIFAEGNNITFSYGQVAPSVTGSISGGALNSGDVAGDYSSVAFSLKMDLSENFSMTLINDQPYGASVDYTNADVLSATTFYPLVNTTASIDSNATTLIGRYALGNGMSVYAGLRNQTISAQANLPGLSYTLDMQADSATGYLAGVAYEIPEIALRASLTYNSDISTSHTTVENGAPSLNTAVTSPKSWHLEAQSGIAEDTLLFGSIRWVNWSNFSVTPAGYGLATGEPILSYDNDSTTYTLGVGRKIDDQWSASLSARYEKANGGTGSNLAPTDGSTGLTVGARYTMDNITISGGLNYTWLGGTTTDVPVTGGTTPGTFANNSAVGAGLSISIGF